MSKPARSFVFLIVLVLLGLAVGNLAPAPPPGAHFDPAAALHHGFFVSGDESECLACHRGVYDIREAAPTLYQGRRLFATLGCVDCHRMDSVPDYERRKIGPDLRHIDSKLSKAFVAHWIVDPASFRATTSMPRILSPDNPNAALEAAAITDYLFANSTPLNDSIPAGLTGDAGRGQLLFEGHGLEDSQAIAAHLPVGLKAGLGCLACHANPREGSPPVAHFAPDLSAIGNDLTAGRDQEQARRWVFNWLKNPHHYSDYTLMPNLRLSDQEAIDLAVYLLSQRRTESGQWQEQAPVQALPHTEMIDLGARLIAHYGCANCHEISGPASLRQTALDLSDWGDKPLEKLDFSRLKPSQHTRRDWLMQHLIDPRVPAANIFYSQPRMPIFHLPQDKAEAVTTYVLANRHWPVDPELVNQASNPQALALARGRALTELHNCVGCHQTETNTPEIQGHFNANWMSTYAPPSLRGEASKVRADWLADFLPNVRSIRPLPLVRMPSFTWRPGEVDALIDYFHAASVRESEDLRGWMNGGRTAALDQWALLHGQVARIDLDARYSSPVEIAAARRDIRFKAEFTADLYELPDAPPPVSMSETDFARGEKFMQTLQCLDCHLMGTALQGRDAGRARAPDLDLAYARLHPRWVRAWIQEPDILQHGANMPPYFSGLVSHDLSGRARALPTDEFGCTVKEQTDLLINFLYAAGARHYVTQPKR